MVTNPKLAVERKKKTETLFCEPLDTEAQHSFPCQGSFFRKVVVFQAEGSVIWQAVGKAGYRVTEVAALLGCHPSDVTRA